MSEGNQTRVLRPGPPATFLRVKQGLGRRFFLVRRDRAARMELGTHFHQVKGDRGCPWPKLKRWIHSS